MLPDRHRATRRHPSRLNSVSDCRVPRARSAWRTAEVLVVGGGPAGAAAAYWLARHGHAVTIVERRTFPRDKTCGDALDAARRQATRGHGSRRSSSTTRTATRACASPASAATSRCHGPSIPSIPRHGYVIQRSRLDACGRRTTRSPPARRCSHGHEAVRPLVSRGFVRGAVVQGPSGRQREVVAKYVVVADGANSRFGRSLGTFRTSDWPYRTRRSARTGRRRVMPNRGSSPRSTSRPQRPCVPGYGWVFPAGDGTANIGVGLLSTFRDFKTVNTTHLLESLRPAHRRAMGHRSRPADAQGGLRHGSRWVVRCPRSRARPISWSAMRPASVNPFNGDGIDYAYETGRIAADVLHEALIHQRRIRAAAVLQAARRRVRPVLQGRRRLFARVIGRPSVMRELTRVACTTAR